MYSRSHSLMPHTNKKKNQYASIKKNPAIYLPHYKTKHTYEFSY